MIDEGKKARKFEWGLRPKIRQQLYVFELSTYSAIFVKAQLIEKNLRIFPPAVCNSKSPVLPHRPAPTAPNQQNKRSKPATQAPSQAPMTGCSKICQ